MTIPQKLQEMLEAEIAKGAAGRLEYLKGVYLGDIDNFPESQYPLVEIVAAKGRFPYNGNFIQKERNFTLFLHVLDKSIQDADALIDELVLNDQEDPLTGIIPFFLKNRGFKIGSRSYELTIGEAETMYGKEEGKRSTAAAEIPLTVMTEIELK